jgi:hypothetical protein
MKLFALALSLAAFACQATSTSLVRVDGPGRRIAAGGGSELELPAGWVYHSGPDGIVAARENPFVHLLTFAYVEPTGPEDKDNDPRQTPAELAEQYVAKAKSSGGWSHVEVVSNEPFALDGRPGCRLHVRLSSPEQREPAREAVLCAAGHGKGIYKLSYVAWAGEHFARDLPLFDAMVASLQLPDAPAP